MGEHRILVVEDQTDILTGIQELLESEGLTVITASNGFHALQVLEQNRPDLIVADIMMPEMDGYALYDAVRGRPEWSSTPFIFLTGKATKDDVLKGKALGAEDYITKPFDPQELVTVIRARLRRAKAMQAISQAEVEQLQTELVTILGHELRTPLTYVSCYTEMALDRIRSLGSDELQLFLSRAKAGADRLAKLVEDILLLAQLDTGQAAQEFEQFAAVSKELGAVVMRTVQRHEPYAMTFGLALQIQCDPDLPPVRLAEALFENALGRLVHNAIKYSRGKGKRVAVRVQSTDDGIEVVVSDEGQGIPPEEIPNLFKRFHQVDRRRLQQQGVGLGLAIARELIRLHGGDITVKSAPGEGSTFAIRLPIVNEESVRKA